MNEELITGDTLDPIENVPTGDDHVDESADEQASDMEQLATQEEAPQESSKQLNFKQLREQKEREQRERERLQRENEELRRYMAQYQQTQAAPQKKRDPNDIAEYKDIEAIREEARREAMEIKLRLDLPDLNQVLTKENLERLERDDPEEALFILNMPDPIMQRKAAYKRIKQMGYQEAERNEAQIQRNLKQPKPGVSAQPTAKNPLAYAQSFVRTEEQRKEDYRQMMAAIKGG